MNKTYKQSIVTCVDDMEPDVLSVEQARQNILAAIKPIEDEEKLALRSALMRTLAEDLHSRFNVPNQTNSAVDGYALMGTDLDASDRPELEVVGTVHAGATFKGTCASGQCIRIMTGAPMPVGTDTVVMQEYVQKLQDGRIRIEQKPGIGQNVRQAGEDISIGSVVLETGHQITPADLGIIASMGTGEVRVRRRPRVAFFSTGNELRSIGEPLEEGQIYDSNRYSLYGMLTRLDVDVIDLGVVRDDPLALKATLDKAARISDVIITSGGVSVGEADYIKPVLQEMGKMDFWKISMKPGRPLSFGHIGETCFFGLPGNPVAVMVTFYQFVQPAIQYIASGRIPVRHSLFAEATSPIRKKPGRYEFVRGALTQNESGLFQVHNLGKQGSGILTSMSQANCFILLPEESENIEPGDMVMVQPFDHFI